MKKILFSFATIFIIHFSAKAQVMAAKPQWITIKSPNLRCWECKERLDRYLNTENDLNMDHGLLKWNYNLLAGEVKFQYSPDRVTPDNIRIALNNAGFDADTTKAEPFAYKKLPAICKLPADGGGPQKNKPCHLEPNE